MADQLTISREYFEEIYKDTDDPWQFESSWYEARKFNLTLAALTRPRYRRVFEPGCAIGVLSAQLAHRCDELVCLEWMPRIAALARERLRTYPHARVQEGAIPNAWPSGTFDLVVFSEVLYYLTETGLSSALELLERSLAPAGEVISVHYNPETNYPLSGGQVQTALTACEWLVPVSSYSEEKFSLAVFRR